jgi:tetratricopeptide (TPR) repeat protein
MKGLWRLLPLLAVPFLQGRLDLLLGEFRTQEETLYVWSGERLARMAPGFRDVLADLYWIRTVQYFGNEKLFRQGSRFELLRPLADVTTTLDPRLEIAYRYGATFLAEGHGRGAGRPQEAVALLEKGVQANPASWRLRQDLGFFHFFFRKDAHRASEVLLEAARLPGAPDWLEAAAALFLVKGGERAASRAIWTRLLEQAEDEHMRANAHTHLARLDALDGRDAIQRAVGAFAARFGAPPPSLEQLSRAGLVRGRLVDPTGVPFDYDPASGTVSVSRRSLLWMPE